MSDPRLMPIVVGAPRSGTTLLRFMLDGHPDLAIPPETGFLSLARRLGRGSDRARRDGFLEAVTRHPPEAPGWVDFGIAVQDFGRALEELDPFTVAEAYRTFYRLYAARFGKPRWGDKTPLYCMEMPTIRAVLPEARFIHLLRDGRDACTSLRRMWFSPGRDMETLAAFWRKCVRTARRDGLGRSDYLEVRYEDLVRNTRQTLVRICAHVDLEYSDRMLHYYTRTPERLGEHRERIRADGTPLVTRQQRLEQQRRTTEPLDATCVFAWKSTMSAEDRVRFRRVAGDLLEELGYDR